MCLIGFRILCHSPLLHLFFTRRVCTRLLLVCAIVNPGIALCVVVVVAIPFVCMCQRAGFHFTFYFITMSKNDENGI